MFDMIGYWGAADAACFSRKPEAKKPYSVINVDGVAWRYKRTANAVICAPTHIASEAFEARLEFDALQAKAA